MVSVVSSVSVLFVSLNHSHSVFSLLAWSFLKLLQMAKKKMQRKSNKGCHRLFPNRQYCICLFYPMKLGHPKAEVCALNLLHFLSDEKQLLLIKQRIQIRERSIREEERPGNQVAKQLKNPLPWNPQPLTPVTVKVLYFLLQNINRLITISSKQKEHIKLMMWLHVVLTSYLVPF